MNQTILEKVAKAMSERHNVRLIAQGSGARTDGRTIYVPSLPEKMTEEQWAVICGYAEHETAHILHSDFKCMEEGGKLYGQPELQMMTNMIEDVRIEKVHGNNYEGSKFLLQKTMQHCCDKNQDKFAKLSSPEEKFPFAFGVEARRQVCGFKIDNFPDSRSLVESLLGESIWEEVRSLKDTDDSIELAKKIFERLSKKEPPKEEPEEQDSDKPKGSKGKKEKKDKSESKSSGSESGSEDSSEASETDGKGKGDKKKSKKSKKSKGEDDEPRQGDREEDQEKDSEQKTDPDGAEGGGDEESGEGEPERDMGADEDGHDDGEPDEKGSGDGDDGKSEDQADPSEYDEEKVRQGSGDDGRGGESPGDVSADGSGDGVDESLDIKHVEEAMSGGTGEGRSTIDAKKIIDALTMGMGDVSKTLGEEMAKMHTDALKGGEYLVYDKSYDQIVPIRPASDAVVYESLKADLGPMNVLKGRITSLFLARVASKWKGDKERGRLNPRALTKVRTGYTTVFRQKEVHDDLDTAITFLVDFSDSMGYRDRKAMAMRAVIAFLETLSLTKIKCEVLGYTTGDVVCSVYSAKDAYRYGRIESLLTYVIKEFDEPFGATIKRRISNYRGGARWNENCDGDSVVVAYNRLRSRREARKILFVLTDGAVANKGNWAAGCQFLKDVCSRIEKEGLVDLIGIGLGDTEVDKYYSKHIEVVDDDPKSLASTLFQELRKVFKV